MLRYRAELDGLRAVAVLSVILFHAGIERLQGGFVGVDIFFVLSGYLISSIVINQLDTNTFSFADFYERRVRRLLPPLSLVIVCTTLASTLLLHGSQLDSFTNSLYSTLGFYSNWYFLSSVGYFDGPGHTTPLLHTWSLSIEEQFYLIFPVLLLLLSRAHLKKNPFVLLLLVSSFSYSAFLIYIAQPESAFYNSLGRFWELLIGALLACFKLSPKKQGHSDCLEITGFAMITYSVLCFSSEMLFPGPAALIPTLGTALIIAANGQGRFITPVLTLKPVVFVGLISYGLYLWHWPILAFINITLPAPSANTLTLGLIATLVLAYLSYALIENPIRKKHLFKSRRSAYAFAVIIYALLVGLATGLRTEYLSEHRKQASTWVQELLYGPKVASIEIMEKERLHYMEKLNLNFGGKSGPFDLAKHKGYTCSFDGGNTPERIATCIHQQAKAHNILIIGDSIARDTLHALRRAFPEKNFLIIHNSGCPATEFVQGRKICFQGLKPVLDKVISSIQVDMILVNFSYNPIYWPQFETGLDFILHYNKKTAVMGVSPLFNTALSNALKKPELTSTILSIDKTDSTFLRWNYDEMLSQAKSLVATRDIPFIDLSAFFCPKNHCLIWIDNDTRKPLFWDNQHLTDLGMTRLAEFFKKHAVIKLLLSESSVPPVK